MTHMHEQHTRSGPPALLNGAYAVADYVAQPLGMLLAAPYLLRHMGASQFGVWILASAAVTSGSLLSSGFGDAAVKYVAMYRGRRDWGGVARIVRGMIAINLTLGGLLAIVLWSVAPYAVRHIPHVDAGLQHACLLSFRIGSLLLAVRSIDGVFVSTLRAFELYAPAVRIAIYSRIGSLVAAVVLIARGFGVVEIMLATLGISALAAVAQGYAVRANSGRILLLPSLHRETLSMIAGFGCFSWLQAISAVIFSQIDKLAIGLVLGAPSVAIYGICAQAAQPIHGIVGAALHVLFPHLSARFETEPLPRLKRTVWMAFKTNVLLVALLGTPMILLGRLVLSLWMGRQFADQAWLILAILAASFALLALNVTAHYTLMAAGRVRLVTFFNLAAGTAMLLLMLPLTQKFGMVGTACARLICGPITCLMYYPLYRMMRGESEERVEVPAAPSELAAWENS